MNPEKNSSTPVLYLALVHYPVVNKEGQLITTSVTNLDIHDISRSSRTYGVRGYFLVTPVQMQQQLLARILGHWESPGGQDYNPDRHEALKLAWPVHNLEQAINRITDDQGSAPLLVATAARLGEEQASMGDLVAQAHSEKRPVLLLFGTGHGLAEEVLAQSQVRLAGLKGLASDGYNHLSVRSAVAIYLDRGAQSVRDVH